MTTIVKTTSKGQITLPMAWRKQFNTNQFVLHVEKDHIKLEPIDLEKILKEEGKKGGRVIFDAVRDNNGEGIPAKDFLKALRNIDE
ncbi:MAG: AbrB/MazE/SpoVT family DNA-binding domain-containing protein [bacterium]|nr:AbrB/MazE/SpoVT family DNA-binding domain-containing protein [bacterium]